jgi:uncharacterized tellurite resistance protein B-like protein
MLKTIVKLYHLLVCADGEHSAAEIDFAKKMLSIEGFDEEEFFRQLEDLKGVRKDLILDGAVCELKGLSDDEQIRSIAWLCVIANADGFMDSNEWGLIYDVYHKRLMLQRDPIMQKQRELNKKIFSTRFRSVEVG